MSRSLNDLVIRSVDLAGRALFVVAVAAGLFDQAQAGESTAPVDTPVRLDFSLLDTAGASHSLRSVPGRSALVCVFLSTECPVANGYVPELNRQFAALRDSKSGVDFFGV